MNWIMLLDKNLETLTNTSGLVFRVNYRHRGNSVIGTQTMERMIDM